jgi:uncharacterized protein YdiU (UPF0061 family)
MALDMQFDNTFVRILPGDSEQGWRRREVRNSLYSRVHPSAVSAPRLVAWSPEVAESLGLSAEQIASSEFVDVLAGNALLPGMAPYAANYGGHQFGQWAGQLGDGRAISLGEVVSPSGNRLELQLKGAGPTAYSRGADGRAVLRSSIREFLCSEAMHHLGVPTTRALSLIATGDAVLRDMLYDGNAQEEPGAIVCRVAPSFIRFGNFELPSSRGEYDTLNQLIDFTIARDFPELHGSGESLRNDWFAEVCRRTARMIAHWMRVGFVHGVMNTDNMSILGLTIDYGPYGWIDNYDPDWTPNTTDRHRRRYRFGQQANIAYWNLACLAQALAPVFTSVEGLQDGLGVYAAEFEKCNRETIAAKLGLEACNDEDVELYRDLQAWMASSEIDMTIFFRELSSFDPNSINPEEFVNAAYDAAKWHDGFSILHEWLHRYALRVTRDEQSAQIRRERMNMANPRSVLRNYLAQQAIDRAYEGDESGILELLDVMRRPYDDQPGREVFAAKRPDWARSRVGCSMLSCSS